MNKKQLMVAGIVIVLLMVIIFQLGYIISKIDYIDWDIRNILGKLNR